MRASFRGRFVVLLFIVREPRGKVVMEWKGGTDQDSRTHVGSSRLSDLVLLLRKLFDIESPT
jgi:hypothetical protein